MRPEHKNYILSQQGKKNAAQIAQDLGIKERQVRKCLDRESSRPKQPQRKKMILMAMLAIVLLGCLVYFPSLRNPLFWDDDDLITDNPHIRSFSSAGKLFVQDVAAGGGEKSSFYRPLQMLSYTLDYSLWRLNPLGYHLTSLFWHILAGLCVFWFFLVLFDDIPLAGLGGLLFVVHPVHTEAVVYAAGRSDPLALTFFLLAFICYVLCMRRPGKVGLGTAMLACFVAALLSREQCLLLPLLILLYHAAFREKIRPLLFFSLVAVDGAYILLRLTLLSGLMGNVSQATTLWERIPGFFVAFATYLRLIVFPFGLHMAYGGRLFSFASGAATIGLILFAGTVAAVAKARRRNGTVFFALSWFLLTLLPVSNLYPINAYMAEHWLYLPSVGIFLLAGYGLKRLKENGRTSRYAMPLILGLLVFFGFLTIRQNATWRDPVVFFQRILKYTPDDARLYYNLGVEYQRRGGRHEQAIPFYKKAIGLDPEYLEAYVNLGSAYLQLGRIKEAIASFQKAVAVGPGSAQAFYDLGVAYRVAGNYDEAIKAFRRSLDIDPNRAIAYAEIGVSCAKLDKPTEAESFYKKALALDPRDGRIPYKFAKTCYEWKQFDRALQYNDKAVELGFAGDHAFSALLEPYRKNHSLQR